MAVQKRQKVASIVGSNIAFLRRCKGWSQKDFAEKLGIGADSVSRFENGVVAPRFERLKRIAEILGCNLSDLFMPPDVVEKMVDTSDASAKDLSPQEEMVVHAKRIIALAKQL